MGVSWSENKCFWQRFTCTSRRITTNVHFHESLSKLNWLITRTKTKVSWDPYLLELEKTLLWSPKSTLCAQTSQNKPKTKVCFRPGCFINTYQIAEMHKHESWNLLSKGCNSFNFYDGGCWERFWPGLLKFKYSEKTTKFVEIFLLVLTPQRNVKLWMRFL